MLQPSEGLNSVLGLLHKAFGSPDVAVKAHIQLVSDGPQIQTDEHSLQDFTPILSTVKWWSNLLKLCNLLILLQLLMASLISCPDSFRSSSRNWPLRVRHGGCAL